MEKLLTDIHDESTLEEERNLGKQDIKHTPGMVEGKLENKNEN